MEYVTYDNIDITNDIKQPNDNLLINSDFRYGVINQKGQSNYSDTDTSITYTADNWIRRSNVSGIEIKQNSIRLSAILDTTKGAGVGLNQPIENFKNLAGKKVTFAINIKAIKGKWRIAICGNTDGVQSASKIIPVDISSNKIETDKIGFYQVTINMPNDLSMYKYMVFSIYSKNDVYGINIGDYIEFDYAKIEKGSYFTGMPVWNKSIELLKCMRNFQVRVFGRTFWTTIYEEYTENHSLIVPMRKTPTITYEITDSYGMKDEKYRASTANNEQIDIRYTPSSSTGQGHRFAMIVYLDAYDY